MPAWRINHTSYLCIMLISWTVVKLNYGKNEQDMSDIQLFWNPLRKEQYLKNKVDIDLHLLSYKTTFSRLIMLSGWAYTNKPLISMLIMFHTGKSTEFLYFTDNHSQQLTKCLFKERKLYWLIHAFFFTRVDILTVCSKEPAVLYPLHDHSKELIHKKVLITFLNLWTTEDNEDIKTY